MNGNRLVEIASAALLVCGSRSITAQQSEQVTFYMVARADTISIEPASRAAGHLRGDLYLRAQSARVHYDVTLGPDGRVSSTMLGFFSPGESVASRVATMELRGDTMIVTQAGAPQQRLATRDGAIPYFNPSMAMLDQALRRARALRGGSSATSSDVPLFAAAGGQTLPLLITWVGNDSATLSLGNVIFRARVSGDGQLLGAVIPIQGVRVTRVDGLQRVSAAVRRDYSAPPGAPYTAEEVTVRSREGITLTGTLTLPKTRPAAGAPAVVTITGSGQQERDESLPGIEGYRIFRQVADTLGRRGIAVLRLDDRGMGGSDAGPTTATSADFANDIRAGLAYLRTRKDVDGTRLGLVGHSEGGMIAPMIAATDPMLKGIVLLAGTAKTGREISDFQVRQAIDANAGWSKAKRDSALALNTIARDSLLAQSAWTRFFFSHDPSATARQVKTPVLILQGAADRQVTPDQAQALAEAFRAGGNRDVSVRTFPATDHLFLADSSGMPNGYARLPSKDVRPEVLGAIADWLAAHLE